MAMLKWLPVELHPVALRVARADELCHEVIRESFEWSREDPVKLVRRRDSGTESLVVKSVDPLPPAVGLNFSEAINHLRAVIDNVVYSLAVSRHAGEMTARQERLIAFPIHDEAGPFEKWQHDTRKKGLVQLVEGPLGEAIAALQPFADPDRRLPSITPSLALKLGLPVDYEHPLRLLQGYSNEDKHRSLRPTLHQNMVVDYGDRASEDRHTQRRVEEGDVLFTAPIGDLTLGEQGPHLTIERPGHPRVPVVPGKELDRLVRYVAKIAVPTLVTGRARADGVPVQLDLAGSGLTMAQRIEGAGYATADQRFRPVIEAWTREQELVGPDLPPLES